MEQRLEEGRICYVAFTRARRHLTISYVERRDPGTQRQPSRFLEAIRETVERREIWDALDNLLLIERQQAITANEEYYRQQPATVQIDATTHVVNDYFLRELDVVLAAFPGAFPVEVLAYDEAGQLVVCETDITIRVDAETLREIRHVVNCPISVVPMSLTDV